MQPAKPTDLLVTGPQEKVVSVAQQNLTAEFLQVARQHRLNRSLSPHWHEAGSLDNSMGRNQTTEAGFAVGVLFDQCEMVSHQSYFGFAILAFGSPDGQTANSPTTVIKVPNPPIQNPKSKIS